MSKHQKSGTKLRASLLLTEASSANTNTRFFARKKSGFGAKIVSLWSNNGLKSSFTRNDTIDSSVKTKTSTFGRRSIEFTLGNDLTKLGSKNYEAMRERHTTIMGRPTASSRSFQNNPSVEKGDSIVRRLKQKLYSVFHYKFDAAEKNGVYERAREQFSYVHLSELLESSKLDVLASRILSLFLLSLDAFNDDYKPKKPDTLELSKLKFSGGATTGQSYTKPKSSANHFRPSAHTYAKPNPGNMMVPKLNLPAQKTLSSERLERAQAQPSPSRKTPGEKKHMNKIDLSYEPSRVLPPARHALHLPASSRTDLPPENTETTSRLQPRNQTEAETPGNCRDTAGKTIDWADVFLQSMKQQKQTQGSLPSSKQAANGRPLPERSHPETGRSAESPDDNDYNRSIANFIEGFRQKKLSRGNYSTLSPTPQTDLGHPNFNFPLAQPKPSPTVYSQSREDSQLAYH